MDQRSIALCFARKGLSAVIIHNDLGVTFGFERMSYVFGMRNHYAIAISM
jgi:hypothetical protein